MRFVGLASLALRCIAGACVIASALAFSGCAQAPIRSTPVSAQELTPTEQTVIELYRMSEAYRSYWKQHVRRVVNAAEEFRRAALLKRCMVVRQHLAPFLAPDYRAAIEQVAANRQRELEKFAGATLTRWQYRAALHAFKELPADDAQRLIASALSKQLRLALNLLAHELVLDEFSLVSTDVISGRGEPAAVIWLKTYFDRAGDAASLRRAVASLRRPALLAAFDRVGTIEQHSPADAEWLAALTLELAADAVSLANEINASSPAELESSDALVRGYLQRVYQAQLLLQPALTSGGSSPAAEAAASMDARYPPPPGLMDSFVRIGPTQVAGDEVKRFCPP
jgi:hypothetical protein